MAESKHTMILEDRQQLNITGISNVDSFNENLIELSGVMGGIDISGEGLRIAALDLDKGRIAINGTVEAIVYGRSREERSVRHKSKKALSRILR